MVDEKLIQSLGNKVDDTERNVYILSGVFGGAILLIFILVSVLFSKILSLKRRIKDTEAAVEHLMRLNQGPQPYGPPSHGMKSTGGGGGGGGGQMGPAGRNPQNVGGGGNRHQGPNGGRGQPAPGYQQQQQHHQPQQQQQQQQRQQGGGSFLNPQQQQWAGEARDFVRDEALNFAQDQAMDQLGNLAGEDFANVMDAVPIPDASDLIKGFPGKKKFKF